MGCCGRSSRSFAALRYRTAISYSNTCRTNRCFYTHCHREYSRKFCNWPFLHNPCKQNGEKPSAKSFFTYRSYWKLHNIFRFYGRKPYAVTIGPDAVCCIHYISDWDRDFSRINGNSFSRTWDSLFEEVQEIKAVHNTQFIKDLFSIDCSCTIAEILLNPENNQLYNQFLYLNKGP